MLILFKRYRDLLWNLTARELKIRYRGSALGFLWSVLIPLFMALIYVFFLRMMAGRNVPMAEIVIGVFAWQFTVNSVQSGLGSIEGNANLVKKVRFPRIILPLAATLANLVNYMLSLLVQIPVVAVLLAVKGGEVGPWWWLLPAVLALHFMFNLGLALVMAAVNVRFRDAQHLVGVGLSAWFFVSPVMYNLDFVGRLLGDKGVWSALYLLNPLAMLVTAYRAAALQAVSFPWTAATCGAMALCLAVFAGGYMLFRRAQKDFADYL
ncbi:MAG: ABC transporter permease [Lentisphaerae bacterium]|nr:ABC transporter permease [Lentisphaerota bacterium]